MRKTVIHKGLIWLIAGVWIINGLFCKILNLLPRHQQILGEILGEQYAGVLTKMIGGAEIVMAVWIVSGYKSRWNALVQILVVGVMNILEFMLVPDLLLWGRFNIVFAALFILVVYYQEWVLRSQLATQP